MSNLWMNVRFGRWHLQGARDWPFLTLSFNHHYDYRVNGEPWFQVFFIFNWVPRS